MATNINQIPDNVLTRDQRFLLNTYLSMYNSTMRQIDLLYNNLDEIRESIDYITTSSLQNAPAPTRERRRTRTTEQRQVPRTNPPPVTRTNTSGRSVPPLAGEEIFEFTFVPRDAHRLTNELQNVFRNFYNPVTVAPTLEQINIATRRIRFSEIVNPVTTTCPISLERFGSEQSVSQIKQCSHIFNTAQLNVWFSNNTRCPVCRYDIRDYRESNTQEEATSSEEEEEKTQEPVGNSENTTRQQNVNNNGSENVISDLSTNITNLLMSDLLRNERATLSFDFFHVDGSNNTYSILNDIFNTPPPRR